MYQPRLNPDGECRPVAIDFIMFFVTGIIVDTKALKKLTNVLATVNFLKTQPLNFIIKLPIISSLSPVAWLLLFRYYKHVTFGDYYANLKMNLTNQNKKYAVLYHLNTKQAYGIPIEAWTHCVVGYKDIDGIFYVYDPGYESFIKPLGSIIRNIKENDLDSTFTIKILTY